MAEPARKLTPEEEEYYRKLAAETVKSSKHIDGIQRKSSGPVLELLSSDNEDSDDGEIIEEGEPEEDQQSDTNSEDNERLAKSRQVKKTPQEQLEKGEIPKYEAQPPEAYKQPPGGHALEPKTPVSTTTKASQGAIETGRGAAGAAEKTSQAVAKAGQAAVKAIQATIAAIRNAVAAIGALFSSAPAWVPVVLIVLGVSIILGAVVIFLKARSTPNANGASPTIAADIINDRSWITKILGLAGDENVINQLTSETLNGLLFDLSSLEAEVNSGGYSQEIKDNVSTKLTEIRSLIAQFQSLGAGDAQKTTVAKNIVKAVAQLVDIFGAAPFHFVGETNYPVAPKKITGFNNTLHGGTPRRRWPTSGHNTFTNYLRGTADATDIGGHGGTPVYAAFAGDVYSRKNRFGQVIFIQGTDNEGKVFRAVYAHLERSASKNHFEAGELIGYMYTGLNSPHLHFELSCNGQSVVTTREDIVDYNSGSQKYRQRGQYLYARMLSVLNLTP